MKRWLPFLICLIHLLTLSYLARQHPFGNYATETDFYHFYAPDAERLMAGRFPENTYQGPGYPAAVGLIGKLTGFGGDLFTVGKWLSVVCAVLCGWMVFLLFERLFGFWVGVGAQLITIASGEFPQFSINAATDIFFLLVCLIALVVFTGELWNLRRRIALSAIITGAAYLVRYNGVFLLAAILVGILLLDMFSQSWRQRLKLSAMFVGVFFLTVSPWLIANYRHHGSPLYNTNYLNIATEFYPELAGGETNQDATRKLDERFQSFGDVIAYDPARLIKRYPQNLLESLRSTFRENLVASAVAWLAWIGFAMALFRKRSKPVSVVLIAGALYLLLMALNHWETRYYFFVMTLYAGFAVYTAVECLHVVRERGWMRQTGFAAIPVAIVVAMFAASTVASRADVKAFLEAQPSELIGARDYLSGIGAAPNSLRIVARKPHLPYMTRQQWVFFPQVKSIEELRSWLADNRVDYIIIGKRELKERKELKKLGDPENAPDWLKPVWVYEPTKFILYKPVKVGAQAPSPAGDLGAKVTLSAHLAGACACVDGFFKPFSSPSTASEVDPASNLWLRPKTRRTIAPG
ncbi:MAG: ArnT family glycosyltransferase [Blastocatellales bacterium]